MADSLSDRVRRQHEEDLNQTADGETVDSSSQPSQDEPTYQQPSYQGAPPPQWQQSQWQQPYPQQPPYQGYYGPPAWQGQGQWQGQPQQQQQSGIDVAEFTRRHIRTPETKEFFKTSEFGAWLLGVAAVLVASAIDNGFDAFEAWLLVSVITASYIISRGLSKAGARRDYPNRDAR